MGFRRGTHKSASYFHGQLFRSATGISFLLINCAKLSERSTVSMLIWKEYNRSTTFFLCGDDVGIPQFKKKKKRDKKWNCRTILSVTWPWPWWCPSGLSIMSDVWTKKKKGLGKPLDTHQNFRLCCLFPFECFSTAEQTTNAWPSPTIFQFWQFLLLCAFGG